MMIQYLSQLVDRLRLVNIVVKDIAKDFAEVVFWECLEVANNVDEFCQRDATSAISLHRGTFVTS